MVLNFYIFFFENYFLPQIIILRVKIEHKTFNVIVYLSLANNSQSFRFQRGGTHGKLHNCKNVTPSSASDRLHHHARHGTHIQQTAVSYLSLSYLSFSAHQSVCCVHSYFLHFTMHFRSCGFRRKQEIDLVGF